MLKSFGIILFAVLPLNAAACASAFDAANTHDSMIMLTEQDNGRTVAIKQGDVVQIELKRSGGTGYEWHLEKMYEKNFELITAETKEIMKEGFVGLPVISTWRLKALEQGDAEIMLILYREWEGKDKAATFFKIRVKIH